MELWVSIYGSHVIPGWVSGWGLWDLTLLGGWVPRISFYLPQIFWESGYHSFSGLPFTCLGGGLLFPLPLFGYLPACHQMPQGDACLFWIVWVWDVLPAWN